MKGHSSTPNNLKDLQNRVLRYSYENKLSHIGSCLSALPILLEIYSQIKENDKVIVSSGHAHLAHAIIMHKENMPAGIHCDKANGCDVSTGSLGQGLPIALGMALADKEHDVYCLISDGECAEGSIWEALRIKSDKQVTNLIVYVNCNGWGAYDPIDVDRLEARLRMFCPDIIIKRTCSDFNDVEGQDAHYKVL